MKLSEELQGYVDSIVERASINDPFDPKKRIAHIVIKSGNLEAMDELSSAS